MTQANTISPKKTNAKRSHHWKWAAILSPHILCCGVLPALGASAGAWFHGSEVLDTLWAKLALAVTLSILAVFADDLWHNRQKTKHCEPCESFSGKAHSKIRKYALWVGIAVVITSVFHGFDVLFHHG